MEEERRLAYVALTRATRRLILGFDPARPSPFLAEMGLRTR
jgi:superfamily I DNA/RNA helicase